MERRVALLRGINVGGRVLPMAELRELATNMGWEQVSSFIASGNLLFAADGEAAKLEADLEQAIEKRFAMKVPVIVRDRHRLEGYLAANPFRAEAIEAPNRLMLLVSKAPPPADAAERIEALGEASERAALTGDGLWIWFPEGAGQSKLSPMRIDKYMLSPATSRNHRTITKLVDLLA